MLKFARSLSMDAARPAMGRWACIAASAALLCAAGVAQADTVYLSTLDLAKAKFTGQVAPQADKTVDGKALTINKKTYDKGVSMNGYTLIYLNLNGGSDSFSGVLGIDDESSTTQVAGRGRGRGLAGAARGANAATSATAGRGRGAGRAGRGAGRGADGATSATAGRGAGRAGAAGATGVGRGAGFQGRGNQAPAIRQISLLVLGDESKVLYQSPAPVALGASGVPFTVDTKGVKTIGIVVNSVAAGRGAGGGGRGAPAGPIHADLAEAKFEVSGAKPVVIAIPGEEKEILTPKPGPAPKINGPALTGVTPGRPVLYKIPATGTKPITFSVENLPSGLKVDPATGIISGVIKDKGTYKVTLHAKNSVSDTKRDFKIVAEGNLALTPALGWNSWNVYGRNVSDEIARNTADVMVSSGLIDHGFTYVNLDDGWERDPRNPEQEIYGGPPRDEKGNFIVNTKFPDMKALGDYIHSKGLKFGIYSGPGPRTCQQLEASWQHEQQDVMQWASWGVDYLKYDWCSYNEVVPQGRNPRDLDIQKLPYQVMGKALKNSPRDMIYSLCQYGTDNVWEWGAEDDIRGNSWRTTGDITDTWSSMVRNGFNPARDRDGKPIDLSPYAGPGHWNDPDMLEIGRLGGGQRDTNLTPAEQYTHITLWTLYSSPMLLGCDITKIDPFTLNLVENDEVLAVHQDELGKTAKRIYEVNDLQVWARPLADGSMAVGLFNLNEMPMKVAVKWSDIGLSGKQNVRDLWRQKDLGAFDGEYSSTIPRHGCMLVKVVPANAKRANP